MNANGYAWRLIRALARRQDYSGTSATQHDGRDGHVESVETPGRKKARNRVGASLNQDSAHPGTRQGTGNGRRLNVAFVRRQGDDLDTRRRCAACPFGRDQKTSDAVVGEHPSAISKAPPRINHSTSRLRTADMPDRQLRIISYGCSDPDDDDIDQRTQPMKVVDAGRTIDVFRMAGSCRDSTIKRLAELTNDHQIVDNALAQGAKQIRPNLRKRLLSVAKMMDKVFPVITGREFTGWEAAELHGRSQGTSWIRDQCYCRSIWHKNHLISTGMIWE